MHRILALIQHDQQYRLLFDSLTAQYELVIPDSWENASLRLEAETFDLCLLNAPTLANLHEHIKRKKEVENGVELPFVLLVKEDADLTFLANLGLNWEDLVDDMIRTPIAPEELRIRLRNLLRSRILSLDLKTANQYLQDKIAENHQALDALRSSEFRFLQLAENIHQIFWLSSLAQPEILYISSAYEKIWGNSCKHLYEYPLSWLKAVHSDDREKIKQIFKLPFEEKGVTLEFRIVQPNGNIRWIIAHAFPVYDENMRLSRIAGIAEDITERKQAELEVQNALTQERELNDLKSHFVSMVSHEFRSPLNTISMTVQLLKRQGKKWSEDQTQESFKRIQNNIEKMTTMLEDILVIGRAERGKLTFEPTPLQLGRFCQNLVSELRFSAKSQNPIHFILEDDGEFIGDSKLLHHILTNLLTNAIKYSPEGEEVEFRVRCSSSEIIFEIRDRGIGIPPQDQPQLFKAFHRAGNVGQIPGTGLGLAIVKQCVDLHGGTISVESEMGQGTTFIVTIPQQ